MSTETSAKKSSENNDDPAGLKASIVKAIFNGLNPSNASSSTASSTAKVPAITTRISSPGTKLPDLSLSEGNLTLTDESKTPVIRTTSQNVFFSSSDFEKNLRVESTAKDGAAKNARKPEESKEATVPEPCTRGPSAEQLAWLKACRKGDPSKCQKLLETNPSLLHYVPPHYLNYSAVHIATLHRHYDLLRLFRRKGANFNATTRSGYTPLHLAAQNQDQETVRMLIEEFGVDTRIPDLLGYTYEYYADWLDYPEYDYSYPSIHYGASSRSSSRQPSMGSQESLASSKNSFSRHGSLRDTIRGLLHIPSSRGLRSRSSSLNRIAA